MNKLTGVVPPLPFASTTMLEAPSAIWMRVRLRVHRTAVQPLQLPATG
jgi:hypothetical protein